MDLMESIIPESLGGMIVIGVFVSLIVAAIAAIITGAWRRVLGVFGIHPKPTKVFVVPDPEAVATRPFNTLPRQPRTTRATQP